jgi:hypothetical protein
MFQPIHISAPEMHAMNPSLVSAGRTGAPAMGNLEQGEALRTTAML